MAVQRAGTRAKRKWLKIKGEQELLPGILNCISVDSIAAKFLTWREICVLSCVSRGWCRAVRSREVYNARLRSQSTETLSLGCRVAMIPVLIDEVFLHSTRNNDRYRLPVPPGFRRMPLTGCLHAVLDGRIYILGGKRRDTYRKSGLDYQFSKEVYVLDLAGQKQWKRCANMKQERGLSGGAVMDGKIYVFGGCQHINCNPAILREPVCGSEVFDPQKNTWTSVKAMPSMRFGHHVVQAGPLLVMHGGYKWHPHWLPQEPTRATSLEVYHPGEDCWLVSNEVWPPGKIPVVKTTTLGDPATFIDCLGMDGTHVGPKPYLSL